ncbi:MAG: DUF6680 family protein [Parasphingorhabdus sp.]
MAASTAPLLTDWLAVGASSLTMLAAFSALIIAWKAPKAAARWADRYRSESEKANEREKLRTNVFISLMKCRSQLVHQDALAALNLLDVAFAEDKPVRDAYRSFIEATGESPSNYTKILERYYVIIEKVAQAVGMSDQISTFDVRGGYYPTVLGKFDEAAIADAEEKIARRQKAPK